MLLRAATSQVNSCSWYQLIRRRMSSNHDNNSSKNSTGQGGDSALFRMKSKYVKLLEDAPMLTKSITSSLLSGGADFICQLGSNSNSVTTIERAPLPWSVITNRLTDYDLQRTITFTILGGALVGPTLHFWYGFLTRTIPGNSLSSTVKRLVLDQFVFAPVFIPVFFASALLLEGHPEKITSKIQNEWFPTVLANYIVWLPAQFLNFKFVSPTFQVLFSNAVGFGWNIYLSYAAHKTTAVTASETTSTTGDA